jgi:hypothetical protein
VRKIPILAILLPPTNMAKFYPFIMISFSCGTGGDADDRNGIKGGISYAA